MNSKLTKASGLLALSSVFLVAHFFSYALVNVALILGVLVAWAQPSSREALKQPWPGYTKPALLALVAWIFLSMAASPESWVKGADLALRNAWKPSLGLLLGMAVARSNAEVASWMIVRLGWFAVAFLLPAIPSMQGSRISLYHSVYGKEILGPNVLGGFYGTLWMLYLGHLWQKGQRPRWHEGLLSLGLLLGVIVSGSRSAFILVFGGVASLVVWRFTVARLVKVTLSLCLCLGLFLAANPRFIPGKFTQPSWDFNVRFSIWSQALRVIQIRPLFGCGARRYRDKLVELYPDYIGVNPDGTFFFTDDTSLLPKDPLKPGGVSAHPLEAHNDYLTMAAQHGLPALVFFLLFWLSLLHATYRQGNKESPAAGMSRALFAVVVGVLGYTCFNACWFNKEWGPFTAWWIGAVLGSFPDTAE